MNSPRSVLMFIGRVRRLLLPRGLVVTRRDALRGNVEMSTVRHSFRYIAEGSSVHGDEFDGIYTNTTKMFRTIERIISKSKIFRFDSAP